MLQAIKVDPLSPWGYEKRHAALHALQRYDEAVNSFSRMLSLMEESPDPRTRRKCHSILSMKNNIINIMTGIVQD